MVAASRVSRKTRPMKCPMRGRQPGRHTTPAFTRERARRLPTPSLPRWTRLDRLRASGFDLRDARFAEASGQPRGPSVWHGSAWPLSVYAHHPPRPSRRLARAHEISRARRSPPTPHARAKPGARIRRARDSTDPVAAASPANASATAGPNPRRQAPASRPEQARARPTSPASTPPRLLPPSRKHRGQSVPRTDGGATGPRKTSSRTARKRGKESRNAFPAWRPDEARGRGALRWS